MASYEKREEIFDEIGKKSKKTKIYLQNSEKLQIEKDSGYSISSSLYCHSKGDIYMHSERTWGEVESRVIKFGLETKSPVVFVCRAKDADFIYEYSYKEKKDLGAGWFISFTLFLGTFGIIPVIESPDYTVSLQIKDKNYVLIKDLGTSEFGHTTFASSTLIPFALTKAIKRIPTKENVIADIVIDKVVESLPDLEKISSDIKKKR